MTSSPVMASGMTTTTAGVGSSGMLTGHADTSGLGGLFTSLMGSDAAGPASTTADAGATAGAGTASGMISVLLGGAADAADGTSNTPNSQAAGMATALAGLLLPQTTGTQTDVQLGDGPALTVSGDAATVKTFVSQLKDIYQKLVVEGGLTVDQLSDSKQLATALTKLGMSQDEAQGVADRVQTMLKLLKDQQNIDDKTAGTLAAMMLTVMGQQAVQANAAAQTPPATEGDSAIGLQILSVEQSSTTATSANLMASWKMRSGSDVTRDLLGFGKATPKDVAAEQVQKPGQKLEVSVTADADATINVGLADLKADLKAQASGHTTAQPTLDAVPSEAAQAAVVVGTTGTAVKVAADQRLEAPKGDTYYRLQADKHGVETLEAVKPASEIKDMGLLSTQASQPQATVAAAPVATTDGAASAAFAARVAQIQDMVDKAQVGQQVAVQMQPLLEQGGGRIRMNLHPHDLGQITVELNVVDGKVHGSIAASESVVVEQLARELHSLRHGLADAGLKLGDQGISLMLSNSNQQGQQQSGSQGQGSNASSGGRSGTAAVAGVLSADAGEDLAGNLSAWVSPDRVLDVNV